jgi:hypothetical protein
MQRYVVNLLLSGSMLPLMDTWQLKKTWGEKIEKHKKFPVYRNLRARITIRKAVGREPTDDEVADEAARIKSKDYTSSLTCKDVIKAFERGEEVRPPYHNSTFGPFHFSSPLAL